jgi:cytochrome b561
MAFISSTSLVQKFQSTSRVNGPKTMRRRPHWLVPTFHWAMALLIAGAFGIAEIIDFFPRDMRISVLGWYALFGVGVLALFVPRIIAVFFGANRDDAVEQGLPERAARWAHYVLYALMVVIPVTGLLTVMSRGKSFDVAGLFTLPTLGDMHWLHVGAESIHTSIVWVLFFLVGAHVLAALWHHFIVRDDVLARYVPGLEPRDD